jgi:hypothetical protein
MIHTTRWSPDTCSCVIDYTWDDTVPDNERTHNLSNVIERCPAHQALSDNDTFSSLMDENPRKNIALAECLENGPPTLSDTIGGAKQLKPNVTFDWSWSGTAPNRLLTVSFSGVGLTGTDKNVMRNALNNKLGANKVNLV